MIYSLTGDRQILGHRAERILRFYFAKFFSLGKDIHKKVSVL